LIRARPARLAVLLAAQAVAWTGFASVLPVLPLYVQERGMPLTWLGWMVAAYSLASLAAQLVTGRWSDRVGRRGILVGGLFVAGAATAAFAARLAPPDYLALRAVWGLGSGAVTVAAMAAVPDLIPQERRGRAYGFMTAAQMAGLAGGPLLGAGLSAALGVGGMFLGGAALALAAAVVALLGLPAVRPRRAAADPPRAAWRGRVRLLLVNAGWTGLIGVYDTAWSVYLHRLGASQVEIGVSWTLFSLPLLLMSFVGGRVADRMGWRRAAVVGGVMLNALVAAGYGVVPTAWAAIALSVLESSVMAMIGPSFNAWLMDGVAEDERGAVQGGAQAAGTVGQLVLALATGYLLPLSVRWPFFLGAGVLFLTGLVLFADRPRGRALGR
jgi:DHA1 family multidrug resistance protein-like MFS transporter